MKPVTASKPKPAAAISRKTTAKTGVKPVSKVSLSRSAPTGTFVVAEPKSPVEKKYWGALSSREADTLAKALGRK